MLMASAKSKDKLVKYTSPEISACGACRYRNKFLTVGFPFDPLESGYKLL